jgi:2-iminobutanoate/2-iminopropanoate deaminase
MEHLNDPELPVPDFPGSHMVIDETYLFVSGLVAADLGKPAAPSDDVAEETKQVMLALKRMLESAGSGLDRVVRVDVHLADLNDIGRMDEVYQGFFEKGRYPARTCTESPRICGGCSVEITVMARR